MPKPSPAADSRVEDAMEALEAIETVFTDVKAGYPLTAWALMETSLCTLRAYLRAPAEPEPTPSPAGERLNEAEVEILALFDVARDSIKVESLREILRAALAAPSTTAGERRIGERRKCDGHVRDRADKANRYARSGNDRRSLSSTTAPASSTHMVPWNELSQEERDAIRAEVAGCQEPVAPDSEPEQPEDDDA